MDDTGSVYLQTFAKYLKQFYASVSLDRIHLMVKRVVAPKSLVSNQTTDAV